VPYIKLRSTFAPVVAYFYICFSAPFNMQAKFTFCFVALMFSLNLCKAQADTLEPFNNGGFERWKGGEFKCCGLALATPVYWGIVEHAMQLATNHFDFKETTRVDVHSGDFSIRLMTDTTELDSAGDTRDNISVLVPGLITSAGIVTYGRMVLQGDPALTQAVSTGLPFNGNPLALNFYMKVNHLVSDTARYAYAFTRWDSVAMKEDTLAVNDVLIPDSSVVMNEWGLYADSIHYIMPGQPDTLHLIFFGGTNCDISKLGNIVWIDDISFVYETAGIVHLDPEDAVSIFPNPGNHQLTIRVDDYMVGFTIFIFDALGRKINNFVLRDPSQVFDVNSYPAGSYYYKLVNLNGVTVANGKFEVQH
jgi:hypothetical protein